MKATLTSLIVWLQQFEFLFPALVGGLVDYIAQIKSSPHGCTLIGIASHLVSAGFFGWLLGEIAVSIGQAETGYGVACGIGGLLGTRVSEVIIFVINRKTGSKIS